MTGARKRNHKERQWVGDIAKWGAVRDNTVETKAQAQKGGKKKTSGRHIMKQERVSSMGEFPRDPKAKTRSSKEPNRTKHCNSKMRRENTQTYSLTLVLN